MRPPSSSHWSNRLRRIIIDCDQFLRNKEKLMFGGSETGKFIVLNKSQMKDEENTCTISVAKLPQVSGDVIANGRWIVVEVGGTKVAGFMLSEVFQLIKRIYMGSDIYECIGGTPPSADGNGIVGLKLVPSLETFPDCGLTEVISEFLSLSFETPQKSDDKDSSEEYPDFHLQRILRENLYSRTIPCTTRPVRQGEIPGRDYNFLTIEQFMLSEKNGDLLESGFYRGHFYGTPRPGSSINTVQPTNSLDKEMLDMTLTEQAEQPVKNTATANVQQSTDHHVSNGEIDKFNGEFITVRLQKPSDGFGFTIVGGNGKYDDFLQIKKIIPNGCADESGKLREGDVLMYVNDICVLGYNHSDVVKIFQTIKRDESVELTVCRPPSSVDSDHLDPLDKLFSVGTMPWTSIYDNSSSMRLPSPRSNSIRRVEILKGSKGFGFTIVDCLQDGQRVKQIFDRERCGALCEGDLILRINDVDVEGLGHIEVVNFLKQCKVGEYTTFELDSRCPAMLKSSIEASSNLQSTDNEHQSPVMYSSAKPPRPAQTLQKANIVKSELVKNRPVLSHRSTSASQPANYANQSMNDYRYRSYSSAGMPIANTEVSGSVLQQQTSALPSVVRDTLDFNITLRLPNGPVFDDSGPGFGFRIVGGMEEGTQVSVGYVVPQSAAEMDGRLNVGDEIVEIDGFPVVNASHARVVDLILQSRHRGVLNLTVRRLRSTFSYQPSNESGHNGFQSSRYPLNVTLRKASLHESFGFVILSSLHKCSSVIGRVIEGTPADRCGQLTVGDRLLAVNGISIDGMPHHNVVNLIKESGTSIMLTVGAPDSVTGEQRIDGRSSRTAYHRELAEYWRYADLNGIESFSSNTLPHRRRQQSSMSSQIESTLGSTLGRPATSLPLHFSLSFLLMGVKSEDIMTQRNASGMSGENSRTASLDSHMRSTFFRTPPIQNGAISGNSVNEQQSLSGSSATGPSVYDKLSPPIEDQTFDVDLPRAWNGYGFSIRGGHEYGLPLFVLRIAAGGPAHMDGRIMPGDQILEINGHQAVGMTHMEAIGLIKGGPNNVKLVLFRKGRKQSQTPFSKEIA
ncbi:hypothetical protein ACOME3_007975 [Neoechinorhynchus agilis]